MSKVKTIAILSTIVMLFSMIVPIMTVQAATDPANWYVSVPGVLDSDYYVLYPYEDNSLTIGFSKFGEMINSDDNTGLQYGAADPFAPPAGTPLASILKNRWLQGWFINITYDHRIQGDRNVWAMALFSDGIEYGKDWIRVDFMNDWSATYGYEDPRDPGSLIYTAPYDATPTQYGGRKTNGTAVTQPIKVLYDGPREFIAETRTKVYDHFLFADNSTEGDVALVEVCITFVFNKVTKEVNLLKDVKSLLPLKEGEKMKIEFSNRGEVDLGTTATNFASYAHFYTQGTAPLDNVGQDNVVEGLPTEYNSDWQLIQTESPDDQEFPYFSAAGPFPQDFSATYDVAQAIHDPTGTANDYVWYAAFWPSVSDWSIDGWENWWHSLKAYDAHYIDLRTTIGEPSIPFYIGEWDFVLYYDGEPDMRTQFRGVTQYGMANRHDANDANMASGGNVIDTEVLYNTNAAFNPWDLEQAVHKDTVRWLEWDNNGVTYTTKRYPVVEVSNEDWDDYGVFSERLVDMNTGMLLKRRTSYNPNGYTVVYNADGTVTFNNLPSHKIKVLYSTEPYAELYGPIYLYEETNTYSTLGLEGPLTINDFYTYGSYEVIEDLLDATHTIGFDDLSTTIYFTEPAEDWTGTVEAEDFYGWATDFKVFKGHETTVSWDSIYPATEWEYDSDYVDVSIDLMDVHWYIEAPDFRDIHVSRAGFQAEVYYDLSYNYTEQELNVTVTAYLDGPESYVGWPEEFMYDASGLGQYEWIEVGRDAASVDSAGAALVSAAFKNKQVEMGIAGVDMRDPEVANQIPNIMAKFGAGTTVADYKDGLYRAALADDWCTYWPVASSNIIGVGGPIANVFSYYSNDFISAFYGIPEFAAGSAYSGKITGIPCWNRAWDVNNNMYNVYASDTSTGYAVIATTIDLNATEIFDVWGHWGRDTFYACQWLYGDEARGISPGIHELQDAPRGVTSIILKIDYADPSHPTFSIVEVLGTKSETLWYHEGSDVTSPYKGGIHDDA